MTDLDHQKFSVTFAVDCIGITFGWRRWQLAVTPFAWQMFRHKAPWILVWRFGPFHVRHYPDRRKQQLMTTSKQKLDDVVESLRLLRVEMDSIATIHDNLDDRYSMYDQAREDTIENLKGILE